jgi:hypothetical protein
LTSDTARRAKRIAAITVAALAGLAVLLVFGTPLVVRGSWFAAITLRLLPSMQGQIHLGGGSLGLGAIAAVMLGRPARVTLNDLEILDPEGVEVFQSDRVTATIQIQRDPLAVVVRDLRPGQARWRFARMQRRPGIGFIAAFLRPGSPPRLNGACAARIDPRPAPPLRSPRSRCRPPPPMAGSFRIEGAELDGLSASFDFPGWGLVLNDIRGRGQLSVRAAERRLQFEVRDVDARGGGMLRILRGAAMVPVPFDRVAIQRIRHRRARPAPICCWRCAGRRRAGRRCREPRCSAACSPSGGSGIRPRMQIRADWQQAADALTTVALGLGARDLEVVGDSARVKVEVASSFMDLDGHFRATDLEVIQRDYRFLDLQVEVLALGPPYVALLQRLSFRSPAGGR